LGEKKERRIFFSFSFFPLFNPFVFFKDKSENEKSNLVDPASSHMLV